MTSNLSRETNESCTGFVDLLGSIPNKHVFAYAMLALSPIAILLNLSLLTSLAATRQVTQNTSSLLIFIIILSDFISGTLGMPLAANVLLGQGANGACMKLKIIVVLGGIVNFSTIVAVLTAIDRYLHMNPDIRDRTSKIKQIFEKPAIYYIVMLAFLLSLLFPIIGLVFEKRNHSLDTAMGLFSTGLLTIYLLLVSFLYTKGYLRIQKFADNNPVYCEAIGQTATAPDYVRRLYKTVLALVLLACVHCLPLFVANMALTLLHILKKDIHLKRWLYFFEMALLLFYVNGVSNCIAILCFNKRARDFIKSKMKKAAMLGK